jgi:hypothetical protein
VCATQQRAPVVALPQVSNASQELRSRHVDLQALMAATAKSALWVPLAKMVNACAGPPAQVAATTTTSAKTAPAQARVVSAAGHAMCAMAVCQYAKTFNAVRRADVNNYNFNPTPTDANNDTSAGPLGRIVGPTCTRPNAKI